MGKLFFRSVLITFGFVAVVGTIMAIAGRGLLESRRVKTDYEEYVPKTQRGQSDNGKNQGILNNCVFLHDFLPPLPNATGIVTRSISGTRRLQNMIA